MPELRTGVVQRWRYMGDSVIHTLAGSGGKGLRRGGGRSPQKKFAGHMFKYTPF